MQVEYQFFPNLYWSRLTWDCEISFVHIVRRSVEASGQKHMEKKKGCVSHPLQVVRSCLPTPHRCWSLSWRRGLRSQRSWSQLLLTFEAASPCRVVPNAAALNFWWNSNNSELRWRFSSLKIFHSSLVADFFICRLREKGWFARLRGPSCLFHLLRTRRHSGLTLRGSESVAEGLSEQCINIYTWASRLIFAQNCSKYLHNATLTSLICINLVQTIFSASRWEDSWINGIGGCGSHGAPIRNMHESGATHILQLQKCMEILRPYRTVQGFCEGGPGFWMKVICHKVLWLQLFGFLHASTLVGQQMLGPEIGAWQDFSPGSLKASGYVLLVKSQAALYHSTNQCFLVHLQRDSFWKLKTDDFPRTPFNENNLSLCLVVLSSFVSTQQICCRSETYRGFDLCWSSVGTGNSSHLCWEDDVENPHDPRSGAW